MFWNDNVISPWSRFLITFVVWLRMVKVHGFLLAYGWAKEEEKYMTWNHIRHLCEDSHLPLIIGGDFNEILSYDEKEGASDRVRREMNGFQNVLEECELRDLGYNGAWYTWERGSSTATRIRKRLDRFVCSNSWLHLFPHTNVQHLLRHNSYHSAIPTTITKQRQHGRKMKGFKFETAWLLDEGCEATVRAAWAGSASEEINYETRFLGSPVGCLECWHI